MIYLDHNATTPVLPEVRDAMLPIWAANGQKLAWNYAVSFALILLAVYIAIVFKPGGTPPGGL